MKEEVEVLSLNKTFSLADLGAAAALVCRGYKLLCLDRGNPHRVNFVFQQECDLEITLDKYWSDTLEIRARAYFDTIKALKSRLRSE